MRYNLLKQCSFRLTLYCRMQYRTTPATIHITLSTLVPYSHGRGVRIAPHTVSIHDMQRLITPHLLVVLSNASIHADSG